MRTTMRAGGAVLRPLMLVGGATLALGLAGCNGGGGAGTVSLPSGPVATVNGTPIGREMLHQFLEATDGENGLRQLINYEILFGEAKKEKLDATDAEIDKLIADKRKQNSEADKQLGELLKSDLIKAAFRQQIRYQLDLQSLVTKDVKMTDAQLQKWYDANKSRYSTPARVTIGLLTASTKQRADTMAQQLKSKTKTFAQLIDEQKSAKDPGAMQSTASQEFPLEQLPKPVQSEIAKLKPNDTSPSLTLTPGLFGVIRLVSKVAANTPTLAEMRTQLERDYKLEQVARQTAAKMPGGFDAAEKQAEQGLMQQNMQRGVMAPPSRSDVMQAMCQSAIQETIDKLHKSATVVVNDPIYDRVAKEFAPAPALPGMPGATPEAATPAAKP